MGGRTTSVSRRSARRVAPGRPPILGEAAVQEIETHLRSRERRRDELYEESRSLRRLAQGVMAHIHEGREFSRELRKVRAGARVLAERAGREERGDGGLAHDALQESVEACLLAAVVREDPLPSPSSLGVGPEEYLHGLGDLVGEVRRLTLASLSEGGLPLARRRLAQMEDLYRTLLRFDAPRSIIPLKPKQDNARALLERTRGDVTLAQVLARAGIETRRRKAP